MKRVFVVLLLAGTLTAYHEQAIVPLDDAARTGLLTVRVLDQFGHDIQNPTIVLREQKGATGTPGTVKPWRNGERISFGTYAVSIKAAGFSEIADSLTVGENVSIKTFCARFGPIAAENVISVNIQPINGSCSSAKLLPLFDTTNRIAREIFVWSEGKVALTNVPSGDYVLVLFEGSRVCRSVPIGVSGDPVQRITISQPEIEPQ